MNVHSRIFKRLRLTRDNYHHIPIENEYADVMHAVVYAHKGDCLITNIRRHLFIDDVGLGKSLNNSKTHLKQILRKKWLSNCRSMPIEIAYVLYSV